MYEIKDLESFDKENIAAIIVDHNQQKQFIFTKDSLINQLKREVPKVQASFDELFEADLKEISARYSALMPIILHGVQVASKKDDELLTTCGLLLINANNTLLGAVNELRSGFRLQSTSLIRTAVEIAATVMHLLLKPSDLSRFNKDDFKSTEAISTVSKLLPVFGQVWGSLSNNIMHINTTHAEVYPLHPYTDKEDVPATVTLGIIGIALWLVHLSAELAFIPYMETTNYWEKVEQGKYRFIGPSEEEIAWIKETLGRKMKG